MLWGNVDKCTLACSAIKAGQRGGRQPSASNGPTWSCAPHQCMRRLVPRPSSWPSLQAVQPVGKGGGLRLTHRYRVGAVPPAEHGSTGTPTLQLALAKAPT